MATLEDDERRQKERRRAAEQERLENALRARGVIFYTPNNDDMELVKKMSRLAWLARTEAQTAISTKRPGTIDGEAALVNNYDVVEHEAVIFQVLLNKFITGEELGRQ